MAEFNKAPSRQATDETAPSSNSEYSYSEQQEDLSLIEEAEEYASNERLLDASKLLKRVENESLLKEKHKKMIRWAEKTQAGMRDLLESPDKPGSIWKKQSESHGHRDFFVYYHMTESNQLTARIDSAIESSLLVPILSVFNESDLYATWMPSYKRPFKLGVGETKKLKEYGRGNQIISVTVNMAWPFQTRETIQHAVAVDVIDEEGAIAVQVLTETPDDDPVIPEPLPGVGRIDFECTILIRGCPADHPCLAKSKERYPEDEELIMISLKQRVDAHVSGVPKALINFVTRTVVGRMWTALLQVAEDVRDGKRPEHKKAIDENRELYDWVDGRISVMMEKVKENSKVQSKEDEKTPI